MFIITKYFGFLDFNYFYTQYIEYWANQKKDPCFFLPSLFPSWLSPELSTVSQPEEAREEAQAA